MSKNKKTAYFAAFTLVSAVSLIPIGLSSGKIEYDLNKATAKLKAEFRFFGDVRPDILKQMVENIEKQWNGKPVRLDDHDEYDLYLVYKGRLSLSTQLTFTTIPSLAEAKKQYEANTDTSVNFIRVVSPQVQPEIYSSSAEMGDYGGGCLGIFTYGDDLASTTTASHEFGHLLGLGHVAHPYHGRPRIMIERGSPLADPEYSYDPTARYPLLNPYFRRVRQEDINEIPWDDKRVVEVPGSGGMRGTIPLGYCYKLDNKAGYFKKKASGR